MRRLIILASIMALAGCASSGPVPIGKDTYMITKESAGGIFANTSAIKGELFKEGYTYCQQQGKVFQVVRTHEQPAIPAARMPSAEVQFMCLTEGDREIIRPKLQREPDAIIERRDR